MTIYYNKSSEKEIRRELRKQETYSENILWLYLRKRQMLGVKFRRQYSVDQYVIDFYCPELKLAVEADGDVHFTSENMLRDAKRQKFLESFGITFVRIRNEELAANPNKAFERIEEAVRVLKEKKV